MALSDIQKWLLTPSTWQEIAGSIGVHPYEYDLGDDSHRMDVVQIVCEAAAKRNPLGSGSTPGQRAPSGSDENRTPTEG